MAKFNGLSIKARKPLEIRTPRMAEKALDRILTYRERAVRFQILEQTTVNEKQRARYWEKALAYAEAEDTWLLNLAAFMNRSGARVRSK